MCAVVTMQVYESRVDFKARLTFRTLIPCSEMTILQQDTFVFSRKLQQLTRIHSLFSLRNTPMKTCCTSVMFVYLGLLLTLQENAQHNSKISHEEVSANIPTLSDFQEVIYTLWHDAWPNNNFELMKELYPQVRGLTEN